MLVIRGRGRVISELEYIKNGNLGFKTWWTRWISTAQQLPRNGKRFAALWGNGDYGRLGLGSLVSQWRPAFCSALGNESLREIACGGAHTLFLTALFMQSKHRQRKLPLPSSEEVITRWRQPHCPRGKSARRLLGFQKNWQSVYATGLNDFGQLGISDDRSYTTEPLEVSGFPKEIVKISAGYYHSSAVTLDGELYMWGKNSCGQLGLGKRAAKAVSVPSKVECLNGVTIKIAALGSEHSIAVTDKGEALSWGGGGSGRLGHGQEAGFFRFLSNTSEFTPRLIKNLEGVKIRSAAAGMMHSACIDENGSLYTFGERTVEKIGFEESNIAMTPYVVSKLPISEGVACGGYHTCAISSGGELYTWGSNENGCLGIGCTDAAHLPERVQGPFLKHPVFKVSCGWKHTAAISEGYVYTWGWGGSHGTFSEDGHSSGGQLGHGSDVDLVEPRMVEFGKNVKAVEVSCGFNHTAAILQQHNNN